MFVQREKFPSDRENISRKSSLSFIDGKLRPKIESNNNNKHSTYSKHTWKGLEIFSSSVLSFSLLSHSISFSIPFHYFLWYQAINLLMQ